MTLRAEENGDGTEKAEGRGEQAVQENEHISEENLGCHPITREAIKLHRHPQTKRLKATYFFLSHIRGKALPIKDSY